MVAQFRLSQVLNLIEGQLDYRFAAYRVAHREQDLSLDHHIIGLAVAVHPLFLINLKNHWLAYAASSLHVRAGLGLSIADLTHPTRAGDDAVVSFNYNFGAGFDVPISDPEVDWNAALGVHYLHSRTPVDLSPLGDVAMTEHLLLFSVLVRNNGVPF